MRLAMLLTCLMLTFCGCTASSSGTDARGAAATGPETTTKTMVPKPTTEEEETVRRGLDALNRGDGAAAVRALEDAIRGGSKSYLVDCTARGSLPIAYVVAGDLDRAASRADELMSGAPPDVQLGLRETRADIECARGDVSAAIALYRELLDDVSDRDNWHGGLDYTYFLEVRAKLRLLDTRVPELEPVWIVGADRVDMNGPVTILTFLSPYVGSYGQVPVLQRIHALPGAPIVAAVVATDADQNVPGPFELPKEMWERPTENTRQRSESWRQETGAGFPVVGVDPGTMPEDSTLFRFDAVVDGDGRVVYVGTQSDSGGWIEEAVVRRMLAR